MIFVYRREVQDGVPGSLTIELRHLQWHDGKSKRVGWLT